MPSKSRTKPGRSQTLVDYVIGGCERYPSRYRALEVIGCVAYFYLTALLSLEIWEGLVREPLMLLLTPPTALMAYLTADFASGFVHWLADSYGTVQTPFLGPKFVAPFREHHKDPLAITRHDFVEANGDNCIFALPVLLPTYLFLPTPHHAWAVVTGLFVLLLSLGVLLTSLAHGWAHRDQRPRWVSWLQRVRLVVSPAHHAVHHQPPHKRHYCITNGWLNGLLDRTRFFRRLERVLDFFGATRAEHD